MAAGRKGASQLNVRRRDAKGGETRKISSMKNTPFAPFVSAPRFCLPSQSHTPLGSAASSSRALPHTEPFENIGALPPSHSLTPCASERRAPRARSACLLLCCRCPLGDRYPPVMSRRACDICIKTGIFNASPALRRYEKPIFPCSSSRRGCAKTAQLWESLCDVIKVIDSSSI